MEKNIWKLNIDKSLLFFIGLMVFLYIVLVTTLLQYSYSGAIPIYYNVEKVLRLAIVVIGMYRTRYYTRREIAAIVLLIIVAGASYLVIGSYTFFDVFFIAFFCRKINKEQVINTFFYSILAGVIVATILYYMGIMPEFRIYRLETNQIRVALGFSHPNVLARLILILCALYILKKKEKINLVDLIIMGAIGYWVYIYPNSITSALVIYLLVVLLAISKIYEFLFQTDMVKNMFFKGAVLFLIPMTLIVVYVFLLNSSGESILKDISSTFMGRFIYGMRAITTYGIHIFGTKLPIVGNASSYFSNRPSSYFVIDCLYIYMPVQYGVIPSALFFIEYTRGIINCLRWKDFYMTSILAVLALYSISENGMALIYSSFIFIYSLSRDMKDEGFECLESR